MNLKNPARLTFFIIAALMLLQLMPVNIDYAAESQLHAQNSQVLISANFVHNDVFIIHNESQKTQILKVQLNNAFLYIPQVTSQKLSQTGQPACETPFDHRKLIQQAITPHFNGNKFKASPPVI